MAHVNNNQLDGFYSNNILHSRTTISPLHNSPLDSHTDFEYRHDPPLRTRRVVEPSVESRRPPVAMQSVYGHPPVDDFDSYMFPESDSQQSSPTDPSLHSDPVTLHSPPYHHHLHYHHHHHLPVDRHRLAHPSFSSSSSSYSYYPHDRPFHSPPHADPHLARDARSPAANHASPLLYDQVDMVNHHLHHHSSMNTPPATLASTATTSTTTRTYTSSDILPSSLPSSALTGNTNGPPASPASTGSNAQPVMLKDIDWDAVDNCTLYTPDGSSIDPTHLYTGYTTFITLIFVPRDAVELCALVYAKLAHLLQQASSRLVFITSWTATQAHTFLSRFEKVTPFPGPIICDPNASLFHAVSLVRSPLRALFAAPRVSAPVRQGVRNAISSVGYRAQNRDIGRNTLISAKRLKAGAVVVRSLRGYSKRPDVVYASEEVASTGVGCYMDVLTACGVNDAFVPDIDVAQLYARFNSMRAASQKSRYADEREASRASAVAAASASAAAAAAAATAGTGGGTGKTATREGAGIESQSVTSTITETTATTTSMTTPRLSHSPGAKGLKSHHRSSRKSDRRNALRT